MGRWFEQLVPPVRGRVDTATQVLKLPPGCTAACLYNRSGTTLYANEYPILPAEVVNIEAIDGAVDVRSLHGQVEFDVAYGNMREGPDCS